MSKLRANQRVKRSAKSSRRRLRDDFAYILDSFPVLKKKEKKAFGEFMSKPNVWKNTTG